MQRFVSFAPEELREYLFNRLTRLGYAVNSKELEDVSLITLDFILDRYEREELDDFDPE